MKKISLNSATENDFKLLGLIPSICWGFTRTPGHSTDTYNSYGADELFMALERFYEKRKNQSPPRYFGLDVCGSREYGGNSCNWEFGVDSTLYALTLFEDRNQ